MNIHEFGKENEEINLQYVVDVLKHCSKKTLWRTFDFCNNYKVPDLGHGGLVLLKPELFVEMICNFHKNAGLKSIKKCSMFVKNRSLTSTLQEQWIWDFL